MAERFASGSAPAVSTATNPQQMTAILTKTIIPSPVVRWILHARIRNSACNDVVFVGDDFIHVKQVKDLGVVQHIASKNDFDGRIRAANVFNNCKESPDEELFFKVENGDSKGFNDTGPPQSLVLTSSRNDLLFIWLATDEDGRHRFVQQSCPMPTFDTILFQPGQHIAVDPQSRAIAVGSHEREVILYSTKPKEKIQQEMRNQFSDWCPVSAQRPLQIQGTIRHMDFLIPPVDDQGAEDEDHIILLVIVVHEGKTRAIRIDWYASSDLHHARIHASQPLDVQRTVPSLLIPLRNAAFLLVHGAEVKRWQNILTGSATSSVLQLDATAPSHPGASPQRPLWVNWCRPIRGHGAGRDIDHLYIIREDGKMYLLRIFPDRVESSCAGDFDCHVSSACASLGDSRSPDIIALGGDMSSGSIQSIGGWFTATKAPDLSRLDWADMEHMETIPNWASVTDLVVSTLPGRSQRSRDGLFVTSGRQPYGAVTELRAGIEASLSAYFELDEMRSITDLWALPGPAAGNVIIMLSSPGSTRILNIMSNLETDDIGEVAGASVGLGSNHRTLAAGTTKEGKIVQITERSIHISLGTIANFEDCAKLDLEEDCSVMTAAIDNTLNIAVTGVRSSEPGMPFALHCYKIFADDPNVSGDAQIVKTDAIALESEPLCASILVVAGSIFIALVAMADGELKAFLIDADGPRKDSARTTISRSDEGLGVCDSIVILKSNGAALAVCGLRDGRVYTVAINGAGPNLFGHAHVTSFSSTTVKLTQVPHEQASAYAMSGLDTCLLSWDGVGADTLKIQNIWISDRKRPALPQGAITACTNMPSADQLAASKYGNSFIAVSGDEFMIATLNPLSSVVPRQIPMSGTPNRLMYSELQRCLVCASLRYSVRTMQSSSGYAKVRETREICPVIDFIPSRSSESSFTHEFGPGERIYALLEWSLKHDHDKTYSFILAGGSYARSSGSQHGRIWFLQPKNKNWEVQGVKLAFTLKFDEPVYALALGEDNCVFVCTGRSVVVYRYSAEMKDWVVASNAVKLASPGLCITVGPDNASMQVSTMQDGLVTFQLGPGRVEGTHDDYRLTLQSTSPRADDGLSHLALTASNQVTGVENGTVLMSTKYGQVLGLRPYDTNRQDLSQTGILFEAQLPRSLTRLRECNIRPRWKPAPPEGMSRNDIIGCSTDGSIIGLAVLDEHLWRRLSWLQRLCEWNQQLSPFSYDNPYYGVGDRAYGTKEWAMPIGLSEQSRRNTETGDGETVMEDVATPLANVMLRTDLSRVEGYHIDGDVLGRLLKEKDPAATLRKTLRDVTERDDSVGQWVRTYYEQEMASVDEVIALLRRVLEDWL